MDEGGLADPNICTPCPINHFCAGGRDSRSAKPISLTPCDNHSDTSVSERPFASVLSCQCEDAREFNSVSLDQGAGELCTKCSSGSFKTDRSNSKCQSCGPNSSSTPGMNSVAGCFCNPGTVYAEKGVKELESVVAAGQETRLRSLSKRKLRETLVTPSTSASCRYDVVLSLPCPAGMYCPGGLIASEKATHTDLIQVAGLSYYHSLVAPAAPSLNMSGFNLTENMASGTSFPSRLSTI